MSMRKRVFEILDKDATVPICELMRRVGCTRATAQYYHRIWRTNHQDRYTYLERHNKPITVASVHRLMLRAHTRLHISAGELPTLLPDMLRKIESKEIR